jgi:hypothetical protein
VRLFGEHGDNKCDALQGAFALIVDQEDILMFTRLEQTGVKLDNHLKAAIMKEVQEGLKSTVTLI